jgi:ketosteroid isomerase-like protein
MSDQSRDRAEIHEILNDHVKALHSKNVDLMVAHNAADFVSCNLAPPLRRKGKEANDKSGIQAWFDTWTGPIVSENRDVVVEIGGDLAFAHGLTHMTGTKTNGEKVSIWFRSTDCFRRRGGKWQVAHSHSSVPFYMDGSVRACIDLTP